MQQIYSTGQVAKLLGLQAYQIEYAYASGQLAEPAFRFLGKRVHDPDDLRRVAEHFGVALDDNLKIVDGVEAEHELLKGGTPPTPDAIM